MGRPDGYPSNPRRTDIGQEASVIEPDRALLHELLTDPDRLVAYMSSSGL